MKDSSQEGIADEPMLSVDTATAALTVALTAGDEVLGERTVRAERNHSVRLLPEIERLVRDAGLRPRDVRAVAVGCGPGSYTGVRIGVTAAKTFAWALGIPVYAVSSLEALALGGRRAFADGEHASGAPDDAWIIPMLDARRGQAYAALFRSEGPVRGSGAGWRRLAADAVVPFRAQAEDWLRAPDCPRTVLFVGETEGALAGALDELAAGSSRDVRPLPWTMAARDIAALARKYGGVARVEDPHGLLPNYTQQAEAEVKLAAAMRREP